MSETVIRLKPARVDPETLAVQALAFIASDDERLSRFLDHSGIQPNAIRAAAEMPGFFLGVLDYVVADERLIAGVAEQAGCRLEGILHARDAMAPRSEFE